MPPREVPVTGREIGANASEVQVDSADRESAGAILEGGEEGEGEEAGGGREVEGGVDVVTVLLSQEEEEDDDEEEEEEGEGEDDEANMVAVDAAMELKASTRASLIEVKALIRKKWQTLKGSLDEEVASLKAAMTFSRELHVRGCAVGEALEDDEAAREGEGEGALGWVRAELAAVQEACGDAVADTRVLHAEFRTLKVHISIHEQMHPSSVSNSATIKLETS
jgi:hypothetical protein